MTIQIDNDERFTTKAIRLMGKDYLKRNLWSVHQKKIKKCGTEHTVPSHKTCSNILVSCKDHLKRESWPVGWLSLTNIGADL